MATKSRRELIRQQRLKKRRLTYGLFGILGLIALALVGFTLLNNPSSAEGGVAQAGEAVPVMPSVDHVPDGTDPGPFNTDPPTSGKHYNDPLRAGFYDEEDAQTMGEYPEGHLVHSLEHGYVIFWYNCTSLDEAGCSGLKEEISQVMDEAGNIKVIAFPWDSIDVPVVVTSWARMLSFESFDPEQALAFVEANRNKSPEPNGE
ncbi:MAG: DUF3105 domain-containing protein [Chloroflexota bacterium]|nr:MAG: DUF3105 domain-containing protein [Chloroflexota bacterium]